MFVQKASMPFSEVQFAFQPGNADQETGISTISLQVVKSVVLVSYRILSDLI